MSFSKTVSAKAQFPYYTERTTWPWQPTPYIKPIRTDHSSFPKISIVTPSFNQGKYIEETIRSVLLQEYPNLEYIIIDGGSTDDTIDIIRKYEPWLAYWESVPDRGQSHAINKGMTIATGEMVAWINSDDIYFPGALHYVARHYIECHPHWIVGITAVLDERLNKKSYFTPNMNNGYWRSRKYQSMGWLDFVMTKWSGTALPQPSSFWSRELFNGVHGLREDLQYAMDHDLTGRMAFHGARPNLIPQVLAGFRSHDRQKTALSQKYFFREEVLSAQGFMHVGLPKDQITALDAYQKWVSRKSNLLYRVLAHHGLGYGKNVLRALRKTARRIWTSSRKGIDTKTAIKRYLPQNPVILEAGAHIGVDTVEFARLFPDGIIYAFEPVPDVFFSLAQNTGHLPNVKLFPVALGDKNTEVSMYVSSGGSNGSSSILAPKEHLVNHPDVLFNETINVMTLTMDSWAQLFDVQKVDLLWLDLQGFELGVLKSGLQILGSVTVIYSEVNLKENYNGAALYGELRSWLEEHGFQVEIEQIYWEDGGNVLFVRKEKTDVGIEHSTRI